MAFLVARYLVLPSQCKRISYVLPLQSAISFSEMCFLSLRTSRLTLHRAPLHLAQTGASLLVKARAGGQSLDPQTEVAFRGRRRLIWKTIDRPSRERLVREDDPHTIIPGRRDVASGYLIIMPPTIVAYINNEHASTTPYSDSFRPRAHMCTPTPFFSHFTSLHFISPCSCHLRNTTAIHFIQS